MKLKACLPEDKIDRKSATFAVFEAKIIMHLKRTSIINWNFKFRMQSGPTCVTFLAPDDCIVKQSAHHFKLNSRFFKDVAIGKHFVANWNR